MSLNPISLVASAAARAAKVRVSGSVSGNLNFSVGGARTPHTKATPFTYQSNGYTMNANGYLANPTHAAQVAANNAGALTRAEAASMGLPLAGRR